MTLPSFLAASISCGVMVVAGGAAARTLAGVTSAPAAATADDALSTSRLDHVGFCIAILLVTPVSVAFQNSLHNHHPLSARHRSAGMSSQTEAPWGMFSAAEATTRICVPSAVSTM